MKQTQATSTGLKKAAAAAGVKTEPVSKPPVLRRDAEANRVRILQAAEEVFAEYGLAATLDDVAAHAGVGVGTVYRRFPDKEALAESLFEQRVDDVVRIAEEALLVEDPWKAIELLMTGLLGLQAPNRALREVVLNGRCCGERVRSSRERILPAVTQVVSRAQRAGVLRPDISPTDFPIFDLMVSGVCEQTYAVSPDLWRRYAVILLDGLRVRRTKPSALPVPALSPDSLEATMTSLPKKRSPTR